MRKQRRTAEAMILCFAALLMLTACQRADDTAQTPEDEPAAAEAEPASDDETAPVEQAAELSGELVVSVEAWMVEKYNMEELISRYEAEFPGVSVDLLTHEGLGANYLQIFLEWAQTASSTADLYFGGLNGQIAPAVLDDLLLPWDDYMTDELAPDRWIPAFLDNVYVPDAPEGSRYPMLPGLGETMNFQINTSYLEQAGGSVDALPTTYEEIAELACALSELTVDGQSIIGLEMEYGINFAPDTWMAAVIAAEGTYYATDGSINWDSQAGKDWIAFQRQIVDAGCGDTLTFTDNNGARNGLLAGQIAMINASNSRSTEGNRQLGSDVAQMFAYPGTGGTLAFSHEVYVPRVANEPELARHFARHAILSEYAQKWASEEWGKMATLWANYDVLDRNDPNFAQVRLELEGPTQSQWRYADAQALRQAYVDQLQAYLIGDQSLDEMIDNLHAEQDAADLTQP